MRHMEAYAHTRGESKYIDDMLPPSQMLHAAVFSSPIAHGKIRALHTDKARQIEGVVKILTAADVPGKNRLGPIIQDETLLAEEEVHFVGQPIAIVIAASPEIAQKGVQRIEIEIDEYPPIIDPREAYAAGQIIGHPRTVCLGNVEEAWEKCDVVVEGSCECKGQEHLYLETQRCRALPLEENHIHVYSSTQSPSAVQKSIAQILGVASHCIEVETKRLGGGFGGKEDQASPWACITALSAYHTRKPVELVLSRLDDIKMTGKRHPYVADFKIGVTKEGKILAYQVEHYQNAGAAADLSPAVLERTLMHSTNSYFIPNTKIFAVSCRTNLLPNTAFRGFGGPQGMFAMECAITKVAEKLGMPREKIQYQNLLQEGDLLPYAQRIERSQAQTTWQEAQNYYHLEQIQERIERYNSENFATKKGFAVMPVCFGISFTSSFLNQASALVHIYTDGSVSLSTGAVEMGQGVGSKLINIATRAFGIPEQRIKLESTNTTRIANMSPSAASFTTDLNGNATLIAIDQLLTRLKTMLAKELNISDPQEITIENEKILHKGQETGWTWQQTVQKAYFSRISLSAQAFYATPDLWYDKAKEKGRLFAYHVFGTAIVEVTLDCLRGRYTIDAAKLVHDLGRPINELIDRGQIEGGLAQGLGWMTMEELSYDKKGKLLSHALSTYKAPDVYFMPRDLQVRLLEPQDNPTGPYGSKAVGEPPLMYDIAVFFALRKAIAAFAPHKELSFCAPMTPERALMELYMTPEKVLSGKQRLVSTL